MMEQVLSAFVRKNISSHYSFVAQAHSLCIIPLIHKLLSIHQPFLLNLLHKYHQPCQSHIITLKTCIPYSKDETTQLQTSLFYSSCQQPSLRFSQITGKKMPHEGTLDHRPSNNQLCVSMSQKKLYRDELQRTK